MEQNEITGGDAVVELLESSWLELLAASTDGVLLAVSFILLSLGGLRLLRRTNIAGAHSIFFSLVGYFVGAVIYFGFVLLSQREDYPLVEALSSLYLSGCIAVGAYGFLSLSTAIARSAAHEPLRADQ